MRYDERQFITAMHKLTPEEQDEMVEYLIDVLEDRRTDIAAQIISLKGSIKSESAGVTAAAPAKRERPSRSKDGIKALVGLTDEVAGVIAREGGPLMTGEIATRLRAPGMKFHKVPYSTLIQRITWMLKDSKRMFEFVGRDIGWGLKEDKKEKGKKSVDADGGNEIIPQMPKNEDEA